MTGHMMVEGSLPELCSVNDGVREQVGARRRIGARGLIGARGRVGARGLIGARRLGARGIIARGLAC